MMTEKIVNDVFLLYIVASILVCLNTYVGIQLVQLQVLFIGTNEHLSAHRNLLAK